MNKRKQPGNVRGWIEIEGVGQLTDILINPARKDISTPEELIEAIKRYAAIKENGDISRAAKILSLKLDYAGLENFESVENALHDELKASISLSRAEVSNILAGIISAEAKKGITEYRRVQRTIASDKLKAKLLSSLGGTFVGEEFNGNKVSLMIGNTRYSFTIQNGKLSLEQTRKMAKATVLGKGKKFIMKLTYNCYKKKVGANKKSLKEEIDKAVSSGYSIEVERKKQEVTIVFPSQLLMKTILYPFAGYKDSDQKTEFFKKRLHILFSDADCVLRFQ